MNVKRSHLKRREAGFTLLELVIVLVVLAVVSGAAIASYGNLDGKMAKGRSAYDMSAIDRGLRLFKVVSGSYPDELDLLTLSDTAVGGVESTSAVTANAGGFFSHVTDELGGADANKATSDGILHFFPATAAIVNSLAEGGIDTVRGIPIANDSGNFEIPNRAFNDAPLGGGSEVAIVPGLVLSILQSKNLGAADSGLLQAITGLESDVTHLVLVLGLGNDASIVSDTDDVTSASFSEAPFDSDVGSSDYGRFLLLFHLGSDLDASDTIEDSEIYPEVRFVGAIDATGDYLEEQFKAAFDGKS